MTASDPRDMTPDERELYHQAAEAQIVTINYAKPTPTGRPKQIEWLVRRPRSQILMQIVYDGGENNLHYHTNSETTWLVLRGRAIFTGQGDKVLADLGPMQGIVLPGGSRYKFSKEGSEDLEILQIVTVYEPNESSERVNLEAHREWMADDPMLLNYENSSQS